MAETPVPTAPALSQGGMELRVASQRCLARLSLWERGQGARDVCYLGSSASRMTSLKHFDPRDTFRAASGRLATHSARSDALDAQTLDAHDPRPGSRRRGVSLLQSKPRDDLIKSLAA